MPTSKSHDREGYGSAKFWLYAFRDHLANLRAFSNCIDTANLNGTGDYQLLVADASKSVKIYGGTNFQRELRLFGVPSALACFYMDTGEAFHKPVVAVAIGPYIFMYRGYKPLYRFAVPTIPVDPQELAVWQDLAAGSIAVETAVSKLESLLDSGIQTSSRTLELLMMETLEERTELVSRMQEVPLVQMDYITCMAAISLNSLEEGGRGTLVVGTEAGFLYVLKSNLTQVALKIVLPSPPVFLIVAGTLELDYRIVASCRDGCVYSVKQGQLRGGVIEPDAPPCAIARYNNLIAVATTVNKLSYYNLKGKRQQTIYFPCSVLNLATITDAVTGEARGLVVALSNGELRVYVGTQLLHVSLAYGTVTAMKYARYGRADGALLLVLQDGSLIVELLHRSVDFTSKTTIETGPPPQQDVPIPVPHLNPVFVSQSLRERKYSADVYRLFQYDLSQLRLKTAKAYLQMISHGVVPAELGNVTHENEEEAESPLRLSASVQGLGPIFKVRVQLENVGNVPLGGVRIVFRLPDDNVFDMPQRIFTIPTLLPSVPLSCAALVGLAEGEVKGDMILVMATHPDRCVPLVSTLVDLPEAELIEGL